jgi:hypothetical protein
MERELIHRTIVFPPGGLSPLCAHKYDGATRQVGRCGAASVDFVPRHGVRESL